MPSHMGTDLQTHLVYTARLRDGRVLIVRWTGVLRAEPLFEVVYTGQVCMLPSSICASFLLTTVVNDG